MSDELLTPEDLAYMRETQAAARPTEALWRRKVSQRTPTGGTTVGWDDGEPVAVRITTNPDEVPQAIAARLQDVSPVQITTDLARDMRGGDRLEVSPTEVYELVTEGDPGVWATAQVVYGRRIVWPART